MKSPIVSVKQWYSSLPTRRKDVMVKVGFICVAVFLLLIGYSFNDRSSNTPKKTDVANQSFKLPRIDMAKESWLETGQRSLDKFQRDQRDLEQRIRNLESRPPSEVIAGGGVQNYAPGSPQEREARLRTDLARLGQTPIEKGGELYPPSPVPPAVASEAKPLQPAEQEQQGIPRVLQNLPPQAQQQTQQGQVIPFLQPKSIMGVYDFTGKKAEPVQPLATDPKLIGEDGTNYTEAENFYSPSGSFFKVSLLTGLDAATGPNAQTQPHPVLLRIQDLSWLPNEVRQNVSGCFVLGEAHGDLSTERAMVRGLNLSCVNRDNQKILDEAILGFMADTDGKLGMRGRVVSKQGQYLARGLIAAFIEGVAKGFDTSVNTTVVSSGGVVTTNEVDGFSDGFKKGASSGFGKAASKLSEFYLKGAEQLFPVIEVNALRHGTFVIMQGKRFSFNKEILIERTARKAEGKDVL